MTRRSRKKFDYVDPETKAGFRLGTFCEHCGDLPEGSLTYENHTSWCLMCAGALDEPVEFNADAARLFELRHLRVSAQERLEAIDAEIAELGASPVPGLTVKCCGNTIAFAEGVAQCPSCKAAVFLENNTITVLPANVGPESFT